MLLTIINFLKKYWRPIVTWIAISVVVISCNETILLPTNTLELKKPTAFVKNDKVMVLVDNHHERLIFANKDEEVVRVVKIGHRDLSFEKIYGVFFVDDRILVSATSSVNNGIVIAKEALIEYSLEGKFLRTRYCADYDWKEDLVRAGFQYVDKSDWGLLLTSFRGKEIKYEEITYQGARTIVSHKLDFIPWTTYRISEFECLIRGLDGWYRYYDGKKDSLTLLNRDGTPYEKYIVKNLNLPSKLTLSRQLLVKNYLFWGSVSTLVIFMIWYLICLFRLLKHNAKVRSKFVVVVGAVVLSIGISIYYTNYVIRGTLHHYNTMAEVECRIAYNNLIKDHSKFFKLLKEKDIIDILNNHEDCKAIQDYAERILTIAATNGPQEAFSGALLIKDRDGRTRIIADTALDNAFGEIYWDLDVEGKDFENMPDVFVARDESDNGVYQTGFRKLYRDDGTCFGFLNLDINTKKIYSMQETLILSTTIKLLILMIAIYIVWFFLSKFCHEYQIIMQHKREGKQIIGGEFINTCVFLGGITHSMEDVLWAFAILELCKNYGGNNSEMVALIVLTTSVGSFCMTSIFPKLRSWFSDTTVFISGIVGLLLAFSLKLMAFIMHNPWLYVIGFTIGFSFVAGIYRPSILALALQINDKDQREKAIGESYVSYAMASAGALLIGTLIQNAYGFITFYIFVIVLLLIVSPILIFAVACSPNIVHENNGFNYKTMWKIFVNCRGFGYVFTMLLPQVIIGLFSIKLCSAILAQVGIDSYRVTNITIAGLALFSLFPSDKIVKKFGMKVGGIIIYCSLALGYLLVVGNNRIGWMIIVSILTTTVFSQSFGNNVLLDMAEKQGYDKKIVNDSNVFLENLLTIPIAWFLSELLGFSEIMVFKAGGLMIFGSVIIGGLFSRLGRKNEARMLQ